MLRYSFKIKLYKHTQQNRLHGSKHCNYDCERGGRERCDGRGEQDVEKANISKSEDGNCGRDNIKMVDSRPTVKTRPNTTTRWHEGFKKMQVERKDRHEQSIREMRSVQEYFSGLHLKVLIVVDHHTISDAAAMILSRLFRRPLESWHEHVPKPGWALYCLHRRE